MKAFLQWLGAGIIVLLIAFFGVQIYTSETYCKNMIDKKWTYDIAQVFYSPINKSCYFATKVYENSSSCYALGGDWPSCTGTKIPTGRLNVLKLKNNGVERTDIGSRSNIIVKLLNTLGFGPIGQQQYK